MDDLKPARCCWSPEPPRVPPSEVHIVVWEKVLSERDSSTNATKLTAENSTLMDISNCDPDKLGAALRKSCRVNDACKSVSRTNQNLKIVQGNMPISQSFPKDTALATGKEALPWIGQSSLSAEMQKQTSAEHSDLSLRSTIPTSNRTALLKEEHAISLGKTSFSGCDSLSAALEKQKSSETLNLPVRSIPTCSEPSLAKVEQVVPLCKTPLSGRTCRRLSAESQKRKGAKFEPYIPRKQRLVTQSCPSSPLCREPNRELPAEKVVEVSWPSGKVHVQSEKSVCDDASDSGYSSNSSNPGSVNCSELLSPDGHTASCGGDTQRERDLAVELEELLPDCLLDERSPKLPQPVNLESTVKTLSAEQDQFLLDLLAT